MSNTTYSLAKSVSITDYMKPFCTKSDMQSWPWSKISIAKKTNRGTEQVYSIAGLPPARATGELGETYFADLSELPATTFTVGKYTIGTTFSDEVIADNQHLGDLMKEAGTFMGDAQSYINDASMAYPFNNAFSAFTMYDSVALCGTHTLKSGDTFNNVLTTSSLTYDNLWAAISKFETTLFTQSGLYLKDTPKYIVYHPSKEKNMRAILKSSQVPGTANNDKNTITDYNLVPIPCRFLTTTTNWFLLGSKFPETYIRFNRQRPEVEWDKDFVRGAVMCKSTQRFTRGIKEYSYIFGNVGS